MANYGWQPDAYDAQDRYYDTHFAGPILSSKDLSATSILPPIYNQLDTQSCVANATAAAFAYDVQKQADRKTYDPSLFQPSRLFIYWNARTAGANITSVTDSGSQNRDAMKSLRKFGVCSEATWQFDPSKKNIVPSDAATAEAAKHQANTEFAYFRLDPDAPMEQQQNYSDDQRQQIGQLTLNRLKQCICEGYPVVFGFWWYANFASRSPNTIWQLDRLPPKAQRPAGNPGGHSVLAIGYQDDASQPGGGRVLIQNSFGIHQASQDNDNFDSDKGLFWIDYEWIKDYDATDDFWTLRRVQ